jgi:hypothetical protein
LNYRPAVFFCHLRLFAPSSPQEKKIGSHFKLIILQFFKTALILKLGNLQLRKSRKVCNPVYDTFFEQFVYESVKDAALEPAARTTSKL